jgi:hypothetical protein
VPGSSPFAAQLLALHQRNLTVCMPTTVTAGQQIDILLLPSRSLGAGNRYLGSVAYTGCNAGCRADPGRNQHRAQAAPSSTKTSRGSMFRYAPSIALASKSRHKLHSERSKAQLHRSAEPLT